MKHVPTKALNSKTPPTTKSALEYALSAKTNGAGTSKIPRRNLKILSGLF